MNDQQPQDGTETGKDTWIFGNDEEHTRPLPPYSSPSSAETEKPRRSGRLTAGVLAGALLLGGAAGVGGSAWYDAWQGTPSASSSSAQSNSDTGGVISANNATLEAGTVEDVAQKVLPSVVRINVSGQSGSGSGSGIVLTS
ncbi:MAG: hypothetical protein EOO74_11605, partial [Myxococcales bacterium]